MKKYINYVLIAFLLIVGTFALTGCGNDKESTDKSDSAAITLTFDSTANKKEYKVYFESNTDDNKIYFDEEYPRTAQIRNENGNYMIDIQIDEMSQAEYDVTIEEEKKNADFKEEKIGSFDGYSYTDENTETITVRALIDGNNSNARVYATMIIAYVDDSNTNGVTLNELYKSSKVQFIVNSISSKEKNK